MVEVLDTNLNILLNMNQDHQIYGHLKAFQKFVNLFADQLLLYRVVLFFRHNENGQFFHKNILKLIKHISFIYPIN